MRPDPRLGLWGRLSSRLVATRRRRRLGFVALLIPGVLMAVAGAQILLRPPLLVAGLVWLLGAWTLRRISEPRLAALEAAADAAVRSPAEEPAS